MQKATNAKATLQLPFSALLVRALSKGVLIGLLEVFWWISILSLIFNGRLQPFFGRAGVFLVLGSLIGAVIISFSSSWRGNVGINQDVPIAILAIVIVSIVQLTPAELNDGALFATVIATFGFASIIYGLASFLIGQLKFGDIVRLLPFPVVAGFLGGTGWLLLMGGISSALPSHLTSAIFSLEALQFWGPAVITGLITFIIAQRISHPLIVPFTISVATLVFYTIAFGYGFSVQELTETGWLIGALPGSNQLELLSLEELRGIQWSLIFQHSGTIFILAMASVLGMLLNVTGLDLNVEKELDINHDLRVTGVANILLGFVGGLPTYTGLSWSVFNAKDGRENPYTPMVALLIASLLLYFATQTLAFLPRLVGGSMVVFMGLDFLYEWVLRTARRLPRLEYGVLLLIVVVVALFGLLEGVFVGLIAAITLFIISYGRVNIVRHQYDATKQKSRVTRGVNQEVFLKGVGHKTMVMELNGYLFFGTANTLLDQVDKALNAPAIRYLLLDFERVSGIDATAEMAFVKLQRRAQISNVKLVLTGLSAETSQQPQANANLNFRYMIPEENATALPYFKNIDEGLQWIEEQQLIHAGINPHEDPPSLKEQLTMLLGAEKDVENLLNQLEKQQLTDGQLIISQGDSASDMYFVEDGYVTAQLVRENGAIVRLETMGRGRVVGELGFYLNQDRTADVVAEGDAVVYRLSRARLAEIEQNQPEVASSLHQIIVRLLSDRVTHLVNVVDALQK